MKTAQKVTGLAIATTAAAMFAMTPMSASAASHSSGKVGHCVGVNACKGTSSCKTANSSCKGQNSCKGTGFVSVDKGTCDQLGGTFEG